VLSREPANVTWPWLEFTIYRTRGDHASLLLHIRCG